LSAPALFSLIASVALKPHNSIRTALDMYGVYKTNSFSAFGCHDYRGRSDASSKETNTAQDSSVCNPGSGKDDFLARGEIIGIVDAPRIANAHLFHPIHRVF